MKLPHQIVISVIITVLSLLTTKADAVSICKNPNTKTRKGDLRGHRIFRNLVSQNHAFADKTLLIKDFVENPSKLILVTCPHGWGKSMNLDMMTAFFQPDDDSKLTSKKKWNYKLFALGKADNGKITPMNIAKHPDIINQYLGQHPVIKMHLRHVFDIEAASIEPFKAYLATTFQEHARNILEMNATASEAEKETHDLFSKFHAGNCTEEDAVNSLKLLSKCLHERFGKKVFIFLDDYDRDIVRLFEDVEPTITNRRKQTAEQRVDFIRQFLVATFKNNDHLEKGFITGVMNLEIARIFSEIPNFKHYNVVRNDFYEYFGLSDTEVKLLSTECEIKENLVVEAKNWYGGYVVTNDADSRLYNIQSVHEFLRKKSVDSFLEETGNFVNYKRLLRLDRIQSAITSLLNRTSLAVELKDLSFSLKDYYTLVDLCGYGAKAKEAGVNAYLRLLFSEGYLTIDQGGSTSSGRVNVKLPNEQVAATLKYESGMMYS